MNSTPEIPDPRLIEAHDLALAALREITPASTIGAPAGYTVEADGVVSLRFETTLKGYPGWFWTVSVARVEGEEPTVLEAELLPGDTALLAPEWVPWAVRLAEYQAAQATAEAERQASGEDTPSDAEGGEESADDEETLDDLDDLDAADFDEDGSPILHAGDLDGVDIDVLDEAGDEDDSDDDEDDSDDDEDDSDEDDEDEDDEDEDDSDEDDEDDDEPEI